MATGALVKGAFTMTPPHPGWSRSRRRGLKPPQHAKTHSQAQKEVAKPTPVCTRVATQGPQSLTPQLLPERISGAGPLDASSSATVPMGRQEEF